MLKPIFLIVYKKNLYFALITLVIMCFFSYAFIKVVRIKKDSYTFIQTVMMKKKFLSHHSLTGKTIVLDPGHGGVDSGTTYGEKILEKDINLQTAHKLKQQLSKMGASVIMTREKDISLDDHKKNNGSRHREDLNARVYIINKNHADIFISIHVDYLRNSPSTLGPIVYYYGTSEKTQLLAQCVQESLNQLSGYKKVGKKSVHSARKGDYAILRETSASGIIVEVGFLSSAVDRTLFQKEAHQEEIAKLITDGIIKYFKK